MSALSIRSSNAPYGTANAAMVNRALADPGAIDDSDRASIRRVAELSLVQYPAQFAELVQAWAQPPVEQPEFVFLSLSHGPHPRVL